MKRGEFSVIETFFRPLTDSRPEALGLLDDAAVLTPTLGHQIVVTSDALTEGVHFLSSTRASDVAHKALGVNLSDLAAMGAVPLAYTLTLSLPVSTDDAWFADFSSGLAQCQSVHGIFLAGGDTTATNGPLGLSITAFGQVPEGRALTRGGAQPGDDLYVSGTIGDAALGLLVVRDRKTLGDNDKALSDRYHRPNPRTSLGPQLLGIATACIDISDGLIADIGHICSVSRVSAKISADEIPLSSGAKDALARNPALLQTIATGGDDYELAFTAPVSQANAVSEIAGFLGLPINRIGSILEGDEVAVYDRDGRLITFDKIGYRHF